MTRFQIGALGVMVALSTIVGSLSTAVAGPINEFNLIALGNLTGNSEVEGRAFVGGNVSGNAKNFVTMAAGLNSPVSTSGLADDDGLIIGGQLLSTVNVNNGANVRVSTANAGATVNTNGGGSLTYNDAGVAGIAADVNNSVTGANAFFAGLTANSTIDDSDFNNLVFNATPGTNGIAVFDLPTNFFSSRNGTYDLSGDLAADLYVIRIAGTNLSASNALNPNSNEFNDPAFQSRIAYYFPDATTLNLNALGGSVFASAADLTLTTAVEGTVVANNVVLNGEIHLPTLEVSVPEPSSLGLLLLSTITIAISTRRKPRGTAL
ncbi:collagen-binding domain-containing protein [Adhaeretor mobilis]|uniref:Choice-of-anchor A domain-containing protein n=1 Tax=Adhaeretor mobilis TaxID=1930276 RepID=A0A517N363_9BACT|nr:collagen-binding domain-containing protein [Adhaeretor mobilis]QDT01579.1 hypothetical protein HG15A2_49260 [Adhaeretor mobilis]